MGCVNNVFEHQQYLISCLQRVFNELRRYRLTKKEREKLNSILWEYHQLCSYYSSKSRQSKIDRTVAVMSTPRVYDCEDDLPF